MKDKTITARVCDFCPDDCSLFEVEEEKLEYHTLDNTIHYEHGYRCEHEGFCDTLRREWGVDKMALDDIDRSYAKIAKEILSRPNCNNCERRGCEYKVKPGEPVRILCPHWQGER